MRFKVGFFTARHPEIDGSDPTSCYAFLQTFSLNAKSRADAADKAKARVDKDLLKAELTRRWPNAKAVNYTMQHMSKTASKTWGRSFTRWDLE